MSSWQKSPRFVNILWIVSMAFCFLLELVLSIGACLLIVGLFVGLLMPSGVSLFRAKIGECCCLLGGSKNIHFLVSFRFYFRLVFLLMVRLGFGLALINHLKISLRSVFCLIYDQMDLILLFFN